MIALIILSFTSILVFFIVSKIQRQFFSALSSDLKIRLIGNWVFRVASFGLWLGILFFVVFVGLGLLGSRKERKREVRCDFAQRLFLLLPLSVALYTIERVLLSDAPSPLPLSPCSLSDPTSTSI